MKLGLNSQNIPFIELSRSGSDYEIDYFFLYYDKIIEEVYRDLAKEIRS